MTVSKMIDEISFHEEIMPENMEWQSATPHLATLVMWAFNQKYFSDELNKDELFLESCVKVEAGDLTVVSFVEDYLDGAVIDGYFISEVANFLSDYVSLGVYYGDLEKYFEVSSIYFLPDSISELAAFYEVLNKRYSHHRITGELPAYRTLDVSQKKGADKKKGSESV